MQLDLQEHEILLLRRALELYNHALHDEICRSEAADMDTRVLTRENYTLTDLLDRLA